MIQVNVTVMATFGSEIQQAVAVKVLKEFLDGWKKNVEAADKGNQITIRMKKMSGV